MNLFGHNHIFWDKLLKSGFYVRFGVCAPSSRVVPGVFLATAAADAVGARGGTVVMDVR